MARGCLADSELTAALGTDCSTAPSAFRAPRLPFGIDPILGLIPGIGDLASPVFSLLLLWHGARLRVPKVVLARMVLNALIDAGVGAIPVLGDSFDFVWKANDVEPGAARDARDGRAARRRAADYLFVILCALVVIVAALLPLLVLFALGVWIRRHLS